MKKDFDSILDLITTLLDMMLSVAKGTKKLRKIFKKKYKDNPAPVWIDEETEETPTTETTEETTQN